MGQVQELVQRIQDEFRSGQIEIPSLPEVAVKIQRYVEDPDVNVASLAKIIQMDPGLAARLVQVANSPLYRGHRNAEDCRSAVARLGMTTTRNLVTSFALQRNFNMKSAVLRDIARGIWQKSSEVAAISYVLARVTLGMQPDRALLAGLVHNIGALPILRYAAEYPELQKNRALIHELIDKISRSLGTSVLRKWSFDEELVVIPREIGNRDYKPDAELNYVDIVIVAHAHSQFGKDKHHGDASAPLEEIASFRKLPLFRIGPDASVELLYEAREEISLLTSMLTAGG